MDPVWGTVGRIYKEDHYTLLKTKYENFEPCDFGEEDFLKFCKDCIRQHYHDPLDNK